MGKLKKSHSFITLFKFAFITIVSVFVAGNVVAGKTPSVPTDFKLYKNYTYGMARSKIAKLPNIINCGQTVQIPGALCIDNMKFAGIDTMIIFQFADKALVSVILATEFTLNKYTKIFGVLNKKFAFVAMNNGKDTFDILKVSRKTWTGKGVQDKIAKYESDALTNGNITYTFLSDLNKKNKFDYSSIAKAISDAPFKSREINYIIKETGPDVFGFIKFTLPKITEQVIKNKVKQAQQEPIEDF